MVQELTIQNMTCGWCAIDIRTAVVQIPGVAGVEIDVPTRQVRVEIDDNATTEMVTAAIIAAGYTPVTQTPEEQASMTSHTEMPTEKTSDTACSCCS